MERIRDHYGIRSTASLGLDVSVGTIVDESVLAARYAVNGLRRGGISPSATERAAYPERDGVVSEYRSVLQVDVSGDLIPSTEHFYGRAILRIVYRTGPGRRLQAGTTVRGPSRLSQVSAADAVLRSLRAIPDRVYGEALTLIDERWIDEVELAGLPYRIEQLPEDGRCSVTPIFEIPPRVWYHLARFLPDSSCQYTVDPLTGTIRIVYNGDS
jgi:hypothetical protein